MGLNYIAWVLWFRNLGNKLTVVLQCRCSIVSSIYHARL